MVPLTLLSTYLLVSKWRSLNLKSESLCNGLLDVFVGQVMGLHSLDVQSNSNRTLVVSEHHCAIDAWNFPQFGQKIGRVVFFKKTSCGAATRVADTATGAPNNISRGDIAQRLLKRD